MSIAHNEENVMATMGRYCKAYPLARFREFSDWPAAPSVDAGPGNAGPDWADEAPDYLFLQESLVVTAGIFIDEEVVFDRLTPEWEAFCRDTLGFAVPDDAIAANPR
jgi:hypothetical protein